MIEDPAPEDARAKGRAFRVLYALWLFGILSYFIPPVTWSPVSRFCSTRAIVEEGRLTIDSVVDSTGDRSFSHGHWYSDKAPIPALAAVVPYAAYRAFDRLRGGEPHFTAEGTLDLPARHVYVNDSFRKGMYVCSLVTAAASGAALGVLLYALLRRRTTPRTAFIASALTLLGTPILTYSTSFYGHVPAGAFLFGALALLPREAERRRSRGAVLRWRVVGACLACAAGSEYLVAVPAAIVGIWALWDARRDWFYVAQQLVLGAALPLAVITGYQWACFGAPWRTGYSFIARPEFAAGHAHGFLGIHLPKMDALYGLLFGVRRGLFYISPIAIFGVLLGVPAAFRSKDRAAHLAFASLASLLFLNAGYYMWWGGAASGPRHLVPALGALAFGVAAAWERPRLRPFVAACALVSAANCLVLSAVGLEAPETGNVLTQYAYRLLFEGKIAHLSGASNLGIELGLPRAGSLGPLLAWILIGFRFLLRRASAERAESTESAASSNSTGSEPAWAPDGKVPAVAAASSRQ